MKASRKVLMDSSAHFNTVMSGDFDGKDVTEFHEDTSAVPSYGSAHFVSILTNASYRIERGEIYNAIAFSRKSL
jgi:hypothetical protein